MKTDRRIECYGIYIRPRFRMGAKNEVIPSHPINEYHLIFAVGDF